MSFFKNTGEKLLEKGKGAVIIGKKGGSVILKKSVTGVNKVTHGVAGVLEKVNPIPARRTV
jgi:hypothetical protein